MQRTVYSSYVAGRSSCRIGTTLIAAVAVLLTAAASANTDILPPNGDFEAGLATPWGTGQVVDGDGSGAWKNLNGCDSIIEADRNVRYGGNFSLHIVNRTPRTPHVYGTTQQPLTLKPNHRYGISLWARANGLSSPGAVSILVDDQWNLRPIQLPAGSYDWTPFTGEFSLPEGSGQLRILSEDVGEVWLDDVEIVSLEAEEPPATPAVDPAMKNVRALTEGLGRFRSAALQDIDVALAALADGTAQSDFKKLNERIWPMTDTKVGWSYFFSFSVIGAVNSDSVRPIVAYFHPWSDVVLVTSWSIDGETARMTGAEIVPGELLRSRSMPARGHGPSWITDSTFQPAALARNVAETTRAFEKEYAMPQVASWRSIGATLASTSVTKEARQETCAALLIDGMARAQLFRESRPDEPASLEPMRQRLYNFLKLAAGGEIDSFWSEATETLPDAKAALAKMTPEQFRKMVVVSALVGENEGMVFVAPWDEPDLCLSLLLVDLTQAPRVSRVDVISFQAAYEIEQ